MRTNEAKEVLLKTTRRQAGKQIISCEKILQLAKDCGVSPKSLGRLCDREGIKIRQCMLGCF